MRGIGAFVACALALSGSMLGVALTEGHEWRRRPSVPPRRPVRIVSLSLPADEVLLDLVPDPARLFALETFVDDPAVSNAFEAARSVPRRLRNEPEAILATRPDLVILPPWADPTLRALLEHEGVPFVVLPTPRSLAEVRAAIRALGEATGESVRAEHLIAAMDARLEAVRARSAGRPRVRILRWSWSGFVPGRGTLFCEVAEIAGATCATTAAGLEGEVPLGFEQLLALDPDVIVVDSYRADARAREIVVEPPIDRDPRLRSLRAVRTRRLLSIPSAHLLATNHHVAALAEDLAAALAANAIEVR